MEGDRLALSVTTNDGRVIRWGGDEPDAQRIPADLQFGTSMPGGYKDLSCSLLRLAEGQERLFNRVRAYGPGNRTVWDGRLVQFPAVESNFTPGAVGHAAHLRDDNGFVEVYVDQAPAWQEAVLARRLTNATAGRDQGKVTASMSNGGIFWALPNEALPSGTCSEVCYFAPPGVGLASMMYQGSTTGTTTSIEAPGVWSTNDDLSFSASPTTLTLDNALRSAAMPTPTQRGAMMRFLTTGAVTPAAGSARQFSLTAFYGNHGLATQAISGEPDGLYLHDMINDIVGRTCPLLTSYVGAGSVEPNTTFVVPQAAFLDPTTAENAVMLLNGYALWEWGVYDDMRFFWREPDPLRLTWEAREDRGARVSEEGPAADQQYNGVLVQYRDPLGQSRIAGPPAAYWQGGVACADVTNQALVDINPENAVNAAGIPRRWGVLDIGPTTTDAGAVQFGVVWLAEHAIPQRRGTITVSGTVEHPTEGLVPPWRVKAGDGVIVPTRAGDAPRRIIETRYSRADDTNTLTVGNTDFKIDAILERIGVTLVGVTT